MGSLKKRWLLLTFLIQPSIQLERRADERHVGKSLREIAQMLAGGTELLRVESYMIGISQHLFEKESRFLDVAAPRQAFDKTERTHIQKVPSLPINHLPSSIDIPRSHLSGLDR
jgi:hypothetical protein